MHFAPFKFDVVTLPEGTFHTLEDPQYEIVRCICGREVLTPEFQLVKSPNEVLRHFFTSEQIELLPTKWPLPEQFVVLRMPSDKAFAIAVIEKDSAQFRFLHGVPLGTVGKTWILPGARLGKVETTLDHSVRRWREDHLKGGTIVQEQGRFRLTKPLFFTNGTHAASFVVGSRQAFSTYACDIDGVFLEDKPKSSRGYDYFQSSIPKDLLWPT